MTLIVFFFSFFFVRGGVIFFLFFFLRGSFLYCGWGIVRYINVQFSPSLFEFVLVFVEHDMGKSEVTFLTLYTYP